MRERLRACRGCGGETPVGIFPLIGTRRSLYCAPCQPKKRERKNRTTADWCARQRSTGESASGSAKNARRFMLLVTLTDMVAQAEVELENSRLHVQDVMRALADCERALKILEAPPG